MGGSLEIAFDVRAKMPQSNGERPFHAYTSIIIWNGELSLEVESFRGDGAPTTGTKGI